MKKKLVKSVKLLPLSIKSINPIQKYLHITESYACILKIFVCIFLLPKNRLIYFAIFSTSNIPKEVVSLLNAYKVTQRVPDK